MQSKSKIEKFRDWISTVVILIGIIWTIYAFFLVNKFQARRDPAFLTFRSEIIKVSEYSKLSLYKVKITYDNHLTGA